MKKTDEVKALRDIFTSFFKRTSDKKASDQNHHETENIVKQNQNQSSINPF
jgi:hypothetical protein